MVHCSIVGSNNKQGNNSEVTYFNLPKDPQRKSWLATISKGKDNLPLIVFSDHCDDKYFYKSFKKSFLHRQTNKNLISTSIPTLLPNKQISIPRKTSEIKAK